MRITIYRVLGGSLMAVVIGAVGLAQSSSNVLELISVNSAGVQGNQASGVGAGFVTPSGARTAVTPDARFVAFMSFADNLVPGDTNLSADVFVRDRLAGTTERVSVTSRGREGNGHSGISSERVDLSDDGRFVAFDSEATNLVRNDDNARSEVLVRDRLTGTTELISRGLDGNPATGDSPAISGTAGSSRSSRALRTSSRAIPNSTSSITSTCSIGRPNRSSASTSMPTASLVVVPPSA